MDRDEILSATPDELRVLVAEALGWQQKYMTDDNGERTPMANAPKFLFPPSEFAVGPRRVPDWPGDIAAAWELVEEMEREGYGWEFIRALGEEHIDFTFTKPGTCYDLVGGVTRQPSAPLAICRAYLLAMLTE